MHEAIAKDTHYHTRNGVSRAGVHHRAWFGNPGFAGDDAGGMSGGAFHVPASSGLVSIWQDNG